jgi:phenylpyruvate tautomerase PptA (4-oxalocrotonate tautomerase family)
MYLFDPAIRHLMTSDFPWFGRPSRSGLTMPTYTCTSAKGLLSETTKQALAKAITTAHVEITGAPSYFAQVQFFDLPIGNIFIGGNKLSHDHVFIFGHIREGRSAMDRKSLIQRLSYDVAQVAGLDPTAIWVYIQELSAQAMVEFGHILPQPGDEAAWTSALPIADREFMESIKK